MPRSSINSKSLRLGDKNVVTHLTHLVDMENANTIFFIRAIRGAKTYAEAVDKAELYAQVTNTLDALLLSLQSSDKSSLLQLRTLIKRVKYLKKYLQTEYEQKLKMLRREDEIAAMRRKNTASELPPSRINAKALAAFIIQESLKLTARYIPREESLFRLSTVPDKEFSDPQLLAAALRGEVTLPSLSESIPENETNPLERMEELS